jgi:hypothetical protein
MEVVDISYLGSDGQYQAYAPSDIALINTSFITPNFGGPNDYVEYFIKDQSNVVLRSVYNSEKYNIGSVVDPITGTTNKLYLDPEADAKSIGYNRGVLNVKYNFLTRHLLSSPEPSTNFWIKEISSTRTEIKVARQDLSNTELADTFGVFNAELAADAYYPDFYLNFGADVLVIAINAVYIQEDGNSYIIFKLYEPLPQQFDLKSTFWVVTDVADPAEFNLSINVTPEIAQDYVTIKGPNFRVGVKDRVGQTTPFYSYSSLLATAVTSSYQQLQSMMEERGIDINVDYSDFDNFTHFSSATNRLYNFVNKLQLIESASLGIASNQTATAKVILQEQISSIITNFDGYEYYLYFDSASTAWPKQNQIAPYSLYPVTSSQALSWLGSPTTSPNGFTSMSMYWSSSYFDDTNQDLLSQTIPSYILEDNANGPYILFVNMIGQMFDNIWIYLKDVTNLYAANNNPFVGISLEEVANAIRNAGVQLYTNTSISDNIYYSILGINQTGSSLPLTSSAYATVVESSSSLYPATGNSYLSSSLYLPPFGEEKINRYVLSFITGSNQIFNTLPNSQLTGEIYKRIYHNLPYLLKSRGTARGLQALITVFGVPPEILPVHEYGGYNFYSVAGIQEISNTRILTGSVLNISSSLLSPFTTTQYYQYDIEKTSNTVEAAFTPADSINASITSSGYVTSSTQPGYFNIMQYIGAPNLQYSSSYTPLVELSSNYFYNTYTSRYNVWDFIRVIKYYNNSLFKMIKDWVPARASADTGIVVKSHMLERNKYARHEPYVVISGSIGDIGMVTIEGSAPGGFLYNTSYTASIPVQYQSNSVYLTTASGSVNQISNAGAENFTGEYSGSNIYISNEFPQVEVSSYIYPWTSSVPFTAVSGNIMFTTYSIDYLLNNVTGSVISQRFLDLDYGQTQNAPTNYGLITQSLSKSLVIGPFSQSQQPYSQYAQLQDYNYSLRRSIIPRYSGSYMSGLYYNVYTTQSGDYPGDTTYGNDPVINYYTGKLGLFTQLATSSFIPNVVNASLAYFADVSGGLYELNQNNNNWQDLQNTFIAGESLTVKQFDNRKYSNQIASDGVKQIYNSGYNYSPQIYFNTASDPILYFQYAGGSTLGGFSAYNTLSSNAFISGTATTPTYALKVAESTAGRASGSVYNLFNGETYDQSGYYTPGIPASNQWPKYVNPSAGLRNFVANFAVSTEFPAQGQQVTYSFAVTKNGTAVANGSSTQQFRSTTTSGVNENGSVQLLNTVSTAGAIEATFNTFTGPFDVYDNGGNFQGTTSAGSWISASFFTISGNAYWFAYNRTNPAGTTWSDSSGLLTGIQDYEPASFSTPLNGISPATTTSPSNNFNNTFTFSITTDYISFNAGDTVEFKLSQFVTASNANYTASLNLGSLTVNESSLAGAYGTATTSSSPFIYSLANNDSTGLGVITLNSSVSQYSGYQFIPFFVSGGLSYSSSLYNKYGDVNYTFLPQPYDKIIIQDITGSVMDLNVYSSSFDGSNRIQIFTVPKMLNNWTLNSKSVNQFLLLRRYDDEQNILLAYNKPNGPTSYGFLVPNNITPEVTKNINTLQAAVQSQLLSTQANSTLTTL